MKMQRKVIALLLAVSLCLLSSSLAFANIQNEDTVVNLESIRLGDRVMTVPVVTSTEEVPTVTRSGAAKTYDQAATYYIPITDEGLEYNQQYVSRAMMRGTGTLTEKPDSRKYLQVTSHMRYELSDSIEGKNLYILITNVALTKDKAPEGSSGYLHGIGLPTARVVCRGARFNGEPPYDTDHQVANLNLSWSQAGTNTPSSWIPVIRDAYSDWYKGLATYKYTLIFADGSEQCEFTHTLIA